LIDAFICYKQKCKVVSFNLAHPVHLALTKNHNNMHNPYLKFFPVSFFVVSTSR